MFLCPACVCSAPLSCPPDGELEGKNRKVAFPQQLPATCRTLQQEWGFTRQKREERHFPGGPVVKILPSNAGDPGWIPGWGTKIPHARGQLSPCTATSGAHELQWRPGEAKRKEKERGEERETTNSEAKSTLRGFQAGKGRPFSYFPDAKYTSSTWELKPEGTSEYTELSHPFTDKPAEAREGRRVSWGQMAHCWRRVAWSCANPGVNRMDMH